MLSCFNVEVTPLMKILTCMDFLLSKLEEWEGTYASKRLNSVETQINSLKLLVIRFRKIQILSWRNLLNWKREQLIKEDFINSVRLAHTVTKQVFEGSEDVVKILDVCDLFVRDSTLGTYKPRLEFVNILKKHLQVKQSLLVKCPSKQLLRL
jgi:midasin (ATPase involved in ribosome maturation)